jgi:hypothetical protein
MEILKGELNRQFDMKTTYGRVAMAGGERVQLGDQKGVVYRRSPEREALERWTERHFLEVERNIAKNWRRALTRIDFDAMAKNVMGQLGPWRKPKSVKDAKQIADTMIDYMDPEWLIRFGLHLLGAPEATNYVIDDWISRRRPPLREYVPYFIFLLTINLFFCLVLPTQLLKNVKPSHQVDLAYLYYLPFCSVFTSKDNFHAQIVPLFLNENQTFVNGTEFKDELKRLNEYYSALSEDERKAGLINFAKYPPEDTSFLTTQLWDKYLPRWREIKATPKEPRDPEAQKKLIEELNRMSDSPALQPHDERNSDKLDYVTVIKNVRMRKGKWQRFSSDQEQRMLDKKKDN